MRIQHLTRRASAVGGYTLIELVVSMIGVSVLAAGLAASLSIATQSLSVGDGDLADARAAHRVLAQLHRDAQSATAFSELTPSSVAMTVPDRDGDSVPEVIRYAWSGVVGDPLTAAYSGQGERNIAENVQSFSLAWLTRYMEGVSNLPIVLFVSSQSPSGGEVTPSADEQLRADLMDQSGYEVQFISQQQSSADFDEALADVNVAFVSGEVSSGILGSKLYGVTVGVVTESLGASVELNILDAGAHSNATTASVDVTSHYITEQLALGSLPLVDSNQPLKRATGTVAPGAKQLVTIDSGGTPQGSLIAVEVGKELTDGSNAAGRRAQLPWGDNGMNFAQLNAVGEDLMRRTIEWAAGAGGETVASGIVFEEFTEAFLDSGGMAIAVAGPAGTNEGDLLIAAVALDGAGAESIAGPPGWTLVYSGVNNGRCGIGVWWKLATAGESANYDFTWGDGEEAYGWIMRFTGHDPADPVSDVAMAVDTSSTPLSPAVTTTTDNSMVLRLGAFDDDDVNVGNAGLSGHSTIAMNASGSGVGTTSGGAGYVLQPAAGGSGVSNFTLTASEEGLTVTLAINPDPNP